MSSIATIIAVLASGSLSVQSAHAQDGDLVPPLPRPHPERVPDALGIGGPVPEAAFAAEPDGAAPAPFELALVDENGDPLPPVEFTLVATLNDGGEPLPSGVTWRVFEGEPGPDGAYPLVADVEGGTTFLMLNPGRYFLHAMYGWAGATTQIIVTPSDTEQIVVLNAGGLRLRGMIGDDQPINPSELRFEIHGIDPEFGERILIADDISQDEILALSAGRYHVVSYYGDTNAVVRADIDVDPGLLTELSLYHEAARVTLKLVATQGAEALANTAWSIVTQGGEILFDSIGAFPTLVLAAGEYIAIARHDDLIYESTFDVVAGRNRDVEVLLANPLDAPP